MSKLAVCLCLIGCLLLGACGAAENQLTVTATFYPLYLATLNIARGVEGVSVGCLTPPTAGCLHDYQITSYDRRILSASEVIVQNGAGLEAFLDKLLPQLDASVIDASEGVALLPGREEGESVNPHVWVSVSGAMAQAENIARGLAKADPAHADAYRANCEAYVASLTALKEEMATALAPVAGAKIVTFHEAFDYFAREFGLEIAAVVQHEEGSAPSAREVADTVETIRAQGVRALFAEPQYTDESIGLIARETGVPLYTLDPAVTGEADPGDYDAYARIMRQNAQTLLEALQ